MIVHQISKNATLETLGRKRNDNNFTCKSQWISNIQTCRIAWVLRKWKLLGHFWWGDSDLFESKNFCPVSFCLQTDIYSRFLKANSKNLS